MTIDREQEPMKHPNINDLRELQQMTDSEIDYSDIPELTVEVLTKEAKVGEFYRPTNKDSTKESK